MINYDESKFQIILIAGGDEKKNIDTFYIIPLLEFADIFRLFEDEKKQQIKLESKVFCHKTQKY